MRIPDLTVLRDLRAALSLLSRLPLPPPAQFPVPPAVWAWPVAGALLGALASGAGMAALAAGLPVGVAAALVLAMGALLTGAMHEDGLADSCDGLWGGWTRERRLEIMKDSHIGSYGVMGLLLVTLARWSAVVGLLQAGALAPLIAAAALSRAPMAALLAGLPNARGHGLSAAVGRPGAMAACAAGGVALGLALALAGPAGLIAAGAAAATTLGLGALARRKIGGQTGDILGASQQLAEMAALAALAALV